MPKLRDTDDLDVEALEAVEYSTERYSDYTGEIPPIGLELTGYVKRLWWTRSANDDPMLKVLWIADGNEGDLEQYNGCPFWLNAALIPGAKFRWDPFLLAYGLNLSDVKTKTYVAKEEDQNGFVIERIGTWKPGADRDEAWARIITGQELWNGSAQARADEWIAWDAEAVAEAEEPDGEGEDGEDGEGEEPEIFEDADGNLVNADGDYVDEEGNLVDEEGNLLEDEDGEEPEPDPEPEPEPAPRRTRGGAQTSRSRSTATRTAQPARGSRTASKPATAKTGARSRSTAPKPAPARSARATAAPGRARAAKPAAAATPARSTRTKSSGSRDDPPF